MEIRRHRHSASISCLSRKERYDDREMVQASPSDVRHRGGGFEVGEPAKCGMIEFAEGEIEINAGRRTVELILINTGDRPIQIGAHYHIAECNRAMAFDRAASFGMHLDIPSGTAVRLSPVKAARSN